MLKGKGFRSVGRVEVKAETTTPGETHRGRRRSISKVDFVVEEAGAVIRGPSKCFFFHPIQPTDILTRI